MSMGAEFPFEQISMDIIGQLSQTERGNKYLLERIERTLIDTIVLVAKDAKDNWDFRIGLTLMAIRSAVKSSAGCNPHFLMFGREMQLSADVMY